MAARRRKSSRGKKKRTTKKARPGLPSPGTIVEVRTMALPSGKKIRILRTNQKDPYDP